MLDPDDADVAAPQLEDGVDQLARLGVGQAAADLVEQQQVGIARERAGQFEPLAVEQAERLGAAVGDAHHAAELDGVDRLVVGLAAFEAGAVGGGDEDVLEHRHAAERARNLVGAHEAQAAALRRGKAVTSRPLKRSCRFRRKAPTSTLSNVVLPAPFGPTMPTASSPRTAKSTPSSTSSASKRL